MPTTTITYPIIAHDGTIQNVTETVDIGVVNGPALIVKAQTALANNATYLAIGSPSTAQVTAQVQALTRQIDAVIRLLAGQLDTTSGT